MQFILLFLNLVNYFKKIKKTKKRMSYTYHPSTCYNLNVCKFLVMLLY